MVSCFGPEHVGTGRSEGTCRAEQLVIVAIGSALRRGLAKRAKRFIDGAAGGGNRRLGVAEGQPYDKIFCDFERRKVIDLLPIAARRIQQQRDYLA